MKRLLFISTLVILAIACQKEPYSQDIDGEYLVYTAPAKDVNFEDYKYFDVVDSVLVVGQTDKPYYSQSNNALALIQSFRTNMRNRNFIALPDNPMDQLGIQLTFVEKIRNEIKFDSLDALRRQLEIDSESCAAAIAVASGCHSER